MLCSPFDIRREVAPMIMPPNRVSVSDACEESIWVYTPGGYSGPWVTPPYMKRPMNLVGGREYQGVVFMGPAQSAKTFALVECIMGYNILHLRSDMLIVQTRQDIARDFSNERVARLIRHSSGLQDLLVRDNTHDKSFRAGNTIYLGWPTVAQLSGKTLRIVVLTDYDRMPANIDGEGTGWQLSFNRIKTFLSRGKCIAESSPKGRVSDSKAKLDSSHHYYPAPGITSLYHQGTMEQWYWPCPECEEYFQCKATFDETFLYIPECGEDLKEAAEQSRMICPNCGSMIDVHTHKKEMNDHGQWLGVGQTIDKQGRISGDYLNTDTASFGLSGYAAAFQTTKSLVLKYLQAKRNLEESDDDTELMTVFNTQLGTCLRSAGINKHELSDTLQERSEPIKKMVVPEEVRFLTAAVDVQGGEKNRRFVVQVHGWGEHLEQWVIDRFNIRKSSKRKAANGDFQLIHPGAYIEDWDEITRQVIDKVYPLESGDGFMPIMLTACDSGGEDGVTDNAYDYFRSLKRSGKHNRLMLVKGGSTKSADIFRISYPDNTDRKDRKAKAKGDVPVAILNTNKLKDIVSNGIEREDPGQGFVHFPDWLGSWFFEELTYEERNTAGLWVKPGKGDNEALDLFAYNRACVLKKKAHKINWDLPPAWAKPQSDNPNIVREDGEDKSNLKKAAPPQRRSRYRF